MFNYSLSAISSRRLASVVCLFLLLLPATLMAQNAPALIKKGDALDANFKTQEALAVYLEAEKLDPENCILLCQIAKQYAEAMTDTTDVAEKIRLGNLALDYSRRAVDLAPKSADAHLSLAISYGRLALLLDNKTKISYSRLIKKHADIAVKLDPDNDLCWHLLGAWTHGMANLNPVLRSIAGVIYGKLPEASSEDAVQYFKKAIELNPKRPGNFLELGKTYASMGRKEEARAALEKGISLPNIQRDDTEAKEIARRTLANL